MYAASVAWYQHHQSFVILTDLAPTVIVSRGERTPLLLHTHGRLLPLLFQLLHNSIPNLFSLFRLHCPTIFIFLASVVNSSCTPITVSYEYVKDARTLVGLCKQFLFVNDHNLTIQFGLFQQPMLKATVVLHVASSSTESHFNMELVRR